MPKFAKIDSGLCATYTETEHPNREFDLHYHSIYELYYFVDGDADYQVEGRQYHLSPNSLVLLAPYVLHGVRVNSTKSYKRYSIHFDPECIRPELRSILLASFPGKDVDNYEEAYYTDIRCMNLLPFLKAFVRSNQSDLMFSAELTPVYLEAILSELAIMCTQIRQTEHAYSSSEPVTDVINYINEHLSEKITLDSLSKRFFINKDYLNRLFKKNIGTTVALYITHKRIGHAQFLLENGMPASKVATTVGFNDYSSFYRAYKNIIGHSPNQ